MHPALHVAEIASLIVSYIPPWDSHSLAALARTCKSFSTLSLDELWSIQLGLGNLIQCMPADLWDFTKETNFSNQIVCVLTLKRQLYPEDWDRFKFYARRVRVLAFGLQSPYLRAENIERKRLVRVSSTVLEILRLFGSLHPLFPNLKRLDCSDHHYLLDIKFMPMFLGPKLTHLRLHIHAFDRLASDSVLAHLPSLVPHLRGLEISGCSLPGVRHFGPTDGIPFPTRALSGLNCLETFSSVSDMPLSFQSFAELSSLPRLSSLSLQNGPEARVGTELGRSSDASSDVSSSVKDLRLWTSSTRSSAVLLRAVKYPNLQTVNITAHEKTRRVDLGDFFQTLQDQCSHSALVNINIVLLHASSEEELPSTALQPLYVFHNLETLHQQQT